jgi:carbon storage regulator
MACNVPLLWGDSPKRRRIQPIFQLEWERSMLVLSRKLGEKILIGDSIVLTVVKIDRNQIRLGIEAPSAVAIYREEIAPSRVEHKVSVGSASDRS